jgi:hypothetical protein
VRGETSINQLLKQQLSQKKTAIVQDLAGLALNAF